MTTTTTLDQRTSTAGDAAPVAAAEQKDSMAQLLQQLDRLPDSQQDVIRLKFQNELSYREISEITGLTVSNVGFLLHVGLKRLRERMQVELA